MDTVSIKKQTNIKKILCIKIIHTISYNYIKKSNIKKRTL